MRSEPLAEAKAHLDELADDVETTGPILLSRPGRGGVVIVSVDDWRRVEDLICAEETEWWLRSAYTREACGEPAEQDSTAPGLDEDQVRRKYAHLLPRERNQA